MSTRRRALDGLVVLGAVIAAAGFGELLLRAFWPQRSDVTLGMFEQDPDAGYRLRESYRNEIRVPEYRTLVRTDEDGYRVSEEEAPRRADAARLLAIGDSFTFGVGVRAEDAFPAALERGLNRRAPGAWHVRNGGVGGYGPLRSAYALMGRQAAWEPEIVVHAIYVGNDLEDSDPAMFRTTPVIRDGRMITEGRHPFLRARLYLRSRSHLYAFLRARLYGLYHATGLWQRAQYLDPIGLKEWPARVSDVGWPAGREAIAELRDWARERGVRYLVVLIPTRWQIDDAMWEQYKRAWGLPADAFERDHAQREVVAAMKDLGVPVLDLLPAYRRAAASGMRLYYSLDPHWTPAGHTLAAQVIYLELESRGWIGREGTPRRALAQAPPADVTG